MDRNWVAPAAMTAETSTPGNSLAAEASESTFCRMLLPTETKVAPPRDCMLTMAAIPMGT